MGDGVLFLVDAAEGPMPQSYFVLKKAVALSLPIIVVVNKIDKPSARPEWVLDQVFDLLVQLNAPDHLLEFKVIYASAKEGWATDDYHKKTTDIKAIFEAVIKYIPAPAGDPQAPLQILVSSIDYSAFMGRLAIGKIANGTITVNQNAVVAADDFVRQTTLIIKLHTFYPS